MAMFTAITCLWKKVIYLKSKTTGLNGGLIHIHLNFVHYFYFHKWKMLQFPLEDKQTTFFWILDT